MNIPKPYTEASIKTADGLRSIAQSQTMRALSRLSLPEVEVVVDQVARLVPAGNVPDLILSGLARLPDRQLAQKTVRRDINLLFKGVEQTLDKAVYGAFFAGPAAVIWGYQNLLKLAGKNPDDAFPEGTWQFYVDYALREDTARHTNETHGFDTALKRQQLNLAEVDRITAWVMAAIHCLHQYSALLTNEWRERVQTCLLAELTRDRPKAARYARLYRDWARQRPYGRGPDATPDETYPAYRRRKFDQFLEQALRDLPSELQSQWTERVRRAETEALPGYRQQMSILAYLDPGPYGETRTPFPLSKACVGLIRGGNYYLIPACAPGADRPAEAQTVRAQVAAVLAGAGRPHLDWPALAEIKRSAWPALRHKLDERLLEELDALRLAPILLNSDARSHFSQEQSLPGRSLPLSELRRIERGLGDHALTLFDTGQTMVFDQSHIFFDGTWGAALAEIMTQEALAWAYHLHAGKAAEAATTNIKAAENAATHVKPVQLPQALTFNRQLPQLDFIQDAPRVSPEAGAETDLVDLKAIQKLRRHLQQRNERLRLTVNDLLILYRAIHARTYQAEPDLVTELTHLTYQNKTRSAALAALEALDSARLVNPVIVIPVDAGQRAPRDRLYPLTFEVPLNELDLLGMHRQVLAALAVYRQGQRNRDQAYIEFDYLQRDYLARLAGFGELMNKAKEIAGAGESFSVSTIKLLAHLPIPLQRMLEKVPEKFELLNDMIKGREVFSNVGAVAPTSSLTRFISAKDDNDKKTLIWGVITDAAGLMRLSLRDFRPHVGLLAAAGRQDLARRMAQHYLETYALGLNNFIYDLQRMTQASRETQLWQERKHA